MSDIQKYESGKELSVMQMIQAAIDSGISPDTVAVLERLTALKHKLDQDPAKQEFNRAFIALKREVRPIATRKVIPTKDGIKSRFAPMEDIKAEIDPLLERHGFTDTYSQRPTDDGKRIEVTCTLIHTSGHEMSSSFTARGHRSPNNSEAQDDAGTTTFAKRYALCNMLGIVFDYSDDARADGDYITREEADRLEERVLRACNNDPDKRDRYLRLAGAESFAKIRRGKYEVILDALDNQDAPQKPIDRKALAKAIVDWSGMKTEDHKSVMQTVMRLAGVVLPDGTKATEEQLQKVSEWFEANRHRDFLDVASGGGE